MYICVQRVYLHDDVIFVVTTVGVVGCMCDDDQPITCDTHTDARIRVTLYRNNTIHTILVQSQKLLILNCQKFGK